MKKKREPVSVLVEVVEPVVAFRKVLRRVTLSPALADVGIRDLADVATDLGLRIGIGVSPIERDIPRNGTCLR